MEAAGVSRELRGLRVRFRKMVRPKVLDSSTSQFSFFLFLRGGEGIFFLFFFFFGFVGVQKLKISKNNILLEVLMINIFT